MDPISKYLRKFQKIIIKAGNTENAFKDACFLVLGTDIGFFSLNPKGKILLIRANPTVKNAILLNQEKILKEFKIRSGLSFSNIK